VSIPTMLDRAVELNTDRAYWRDITRQLGPVDTADDRGRRVNRGKTVSGDVSP
jgi:hypothetical protein